MKTNLGITTTDKEREEIALSLALPHKMATRNDIKEAVYEYINTVLIGGTKAIEIPGGEVEAITVPLTTSERDQSVSRFVPSRGDEPYLFSSKDSELTDACSAVLDATERLDALIWRKLEENRG